MKDDFHEQIQDHVVFACPIRDVNHLTHKCLLTKRLGVSIGKSMMEPGSIALNFGPFPPRIYDKHLSGPPITHCTACECDSMDDVGNGRIETGNRMVDQVPGYPGPEPQVYLVPKIPESPSTSNADHMRRLRLVCCRYFDGRFSHLLQQ